MEPPEVILVGGPNGAGKTTFALEYSETHGVSYIGADAIAAELSPSNPYSVRITASREFLNQVENSLSKIALSSSNRHFPASPCAASSRMPRMLDSPYQSSSFFSTQRIRV